MTVSFEKVGEPLALAPLTGPIQECRVAGTTFVHLQRQACAEAGLSIIESGGELTVLENVWVTAAGLLRLCDLDGPCIGLAEGRVVAYRGSSDGRAIDLSEEAVLVRYPWDLLAVQERVLSAITESIGDGDVHPHAVVEGTLLLGSGSRILPGVFIEGVAVIGEHCKVGPNAYLRGYTSIGDHCHIGQAVEIKNSIIGSKTAIGHLSYCGDSIVGDGVNFGAGTITSNFRHDGKNHRSMIGSELVDTGRRKFGAIIGDGVHTGIHSSIYPGRKIWPGAMTLPGEVVRKDILTDES